MKKIILILLFLFCTSAYGVGAFSYTKSTNKLVITQGTSGSPVTNHDAYLADQAGTVALLAATAPTIPTLIAHYKMNDNAATSVVTDETGVHNGVYTDGSGPINTDTGDSVGKVNGALDFDGGDEYVSIADHNDFTPALTPFSISAWIYMDDATQFRIVSKGVYDTNGEWLFSTGTDDKLYISFLDESVDAYIGRKYNTALTAYEGQWIHVAATYNGGILSSGVKLYINGVQVDDTNYKNGSFVAVENLAGNVCIGKHDTNYANGLIDDVRFYTSELTLQQVKSLYNFGNGTELTSTFGLTYQLTPAQAKGLKIDFVVASKTTEADYIFVTGTDIDGGAQTESLDVSAGNGTYTTTKWFATITNIDCTDNAAGGGTLWADGTVAVNQNQWGVIWEIVANAMYKIDCNVDFGNGSTATYFTTKNEMIYFADGCVPVSKANATCKLGEKYGDWAVNGSYWNVGPTSILYMIPNGQTGTYLMYGSILDIRSNFACLFYSGNVDIIKGTIKWRDPTLTEADLRFESNLLTLNLKNLYINSLEYLSINKIPDLIEGVHVHNSRLGILATVSTTLTDSIVTSYASNDYFASGDITLTVKNPINHVLAPINSAAASIIIEQYTCNIHISDSDGNDLEGVTVTCTDVNDDEVFSVVTDANGDIAEQNINYKKWAGTSETLTDYSPHTFTLSSGGDSSIIENIVVDHPIVWDLEFPVVSLYSSLVSNVTSILADTNEIQVKLPTNYIMGSSDVNDHDTDIDSILEDTNEVQTDWEDGGRLDTIFDLIISYLRQLVPTE